MTALNKVGPTRIWTTLNGKNVRTNDGNDLGEIKKISENYLLLQKGKLRKHRFWIPKYVVDAFDGKTLWLLVGEEEIRGTYQYGKKNPSAEKYAKEFESFKGTPYGQKVNYGADFDENIRVVENYNNIRNLHIASSSENEGNYLKTVKGRSGLKPRPAEEQMHEQQKAESSQGNETQNKLLEAERIDVTEFASKQPIKFASPKTIERPVQPLTTDSEATEPKRRGIKYADSASFSPVRLPSSQITSETFKKVTEDSRKASIKADSASLSPVRITPEDHISMHSRATTPTAIVHPSGTSLVSSPPPIRALDEHKETVPKSLALDLGSTKMEGKAGDNILPSATTESTAMMLDTSTPIVPDKEIDKKPVSGDPIQEERQPSTTEVKGGEVQQITSELEYVAEAEAVNKIEPALPTLEESGSFSDNEANAIIKSDKDQLVIFQDEVNRGIKESDNYMTEYYSNPFIMAMPLWQDSLQAWIDMYNEFAINVTQLSLSWFDLFCKLWIPIAATGTDKNNNE